MLITWRMLARSNSLSAPRMTAIFSAISILYLPCLRAFGSTLGGHPNISRGKRGIAVDQRRPHPHGGGEQPVDPHPGFAHLVRESLAEAVIERPEQRLSYRSVSVVGNLVQD